MNVAVVVQTANAGCGDNASLSGDGEGAVATSTHWRVVLVDPPRMEVVVVRRTSTPLVERISVRTTRSPGRSAVVVVTAPRSSVRTSRSFPPAGNDLVPKVEELKG